MRQTVRKRDQSRQTLARLRMVRHYQQVSRNLCPTCHITTSRGTAELVKAVRGMARAAQGTSNTSTSATPVVAPTPLTMAV